MGSNVDRPWRHYAKWKMLATEGQLPYDAIYMMLPRSVKSMEKETKWLPSVEEHRKRSGVVIIHEHTFSV